MNAREGLRRIGLVLGALGGIAGGFFGYADARDVWTAHRRFESLRTLPTVEEIARAIEEHRPRLDRIAQSDPAPPLDFSDLGAKDVSAPSGTPKTDIAAIAKMYGGTSAAPAPAVDYDALAAQVRAEHPASAVDYDALARKFGGITIYPRSEADVARKAGRISVFDKSGAEWEIPKEDWPNAAKMGYRMLVVMTDPDGQTVEVHPDDAAHAIQQGYKIGQPTPQFDKATRARIDGATTSALAGQGSRSNDEIVVDAHDLEGIKAVKATQTGGISSIQLSTGEWVQKDPHAFKAFVVLVLRLFLSFLFPVIGFLVPWGSIRVLTWMGTGFFEPTRP